MANKLQLVWLEDDGKLYDAGEPIMEPDDLDYLMENGKALLMFLDPPAKPGTLKIVELDEKGKIVKTHNVN